MVGLLSVGAVQADLSGPEAEAVYGGRVWGMAWNSTGATTSRIWVSTESANSLFWADVDHSVAPAQFGAFQSVPDVDADDNFGASIQLLAVDEGSGWLFFSAPTGLFRVSESAGSLTQLDTGSAQALCSHDGTLYWLSAGQLHFASIAPADGSLSEDAHSPLAVPSGPAPNMCLQVASWNGADHLFLFAPGSATPLWISSEETGSFDAGTVLVTLDMTGLTDPAHCTAFGAGPDGRLFLGFVQGVEPAHQKALAWRDSLASGWTESTTGIGGTSGTWLHCADALPTYRVYFGTACSDSLGAPGTWHSIGYLGQETHPNDSGVQGCPLDPDLIICTTDQGIGASQDGGDTIHEIDEGLEAVQVKDLEMDSAKDVAWLASKSGLRQVRDYQTTPVWSDAIFPNGDGSPYYSIAMDTTDATGNTVYAGNVRVYRSMDGGASWHQGLDAQQPPWSLGFFGAVSAIEVDPWDAGRVAAGYICHDASEKGRIFLSENGGDSFDLVAGGDLPSDGADVNDLLFTSEGGSSVLYVGVDYTYSLGHGTSYAVYRVEGSHSSGWTITQDMSFAASIKDLAADGAGGLYAAGGDVGEHPVVYHKAAGGSWTPLSWSNLPALGAVTAITAGDDGLGNTIPYVAVGGSIYYLSSGASAWTWAHTYPAGMEVNALYYDELLVATGTGLYNQDTVSSATPPTASMCGTACGGVTREELAANPPALLVDDADQDEVVLSWFAGDSLLCQQVVTSAAPCQTICPGFLDVAGVSRFRYELSDGTWTVDGCEWELVSGLGSPRRPKDLRLGPAHPNPFNPRTNVVLELDRSQHVEVAIYNLSGARVVLLQDGVLSAGSHTLQWEAGRWPSGLYLLQARAGSRVEQQKLMLLK